LNLDGKVFRYVEHEMFNYALTKGAITDLRDEIINSTPTRDDLMTTVDTGRISNPTAARGSLLATNVALLRMDRTVRAIDRALELLGEEHNLVFKMKYEKNMNWRHILSETYMGQETYFRKRRELVQMVAVQMGLAEP
jgi:RinA family phage transcriptional activator